MRTAHNMPTRIGLCPDPAHIGEFYLPLGSSETSRCPEPGCDLELAIYAPVGRAQRSPSALEAEIERLRQALVDIAGYESFQGHPTPHEIAKAALRDDIYILFFKDGVEVAAVPSTLREDGSRIYDFPALPVGEYTAFLRDPTDGTGWPVSVRDADAGSDAPIVGYTVGSR